MSIISDIKNFNSENIVFGDVKVFTKPATFQRIPIQYKYDDGTIAKLAIETSVLHSWGVQENKNKTTGKIDSYTFSLVMFDARNGPTKKEAETISIFEQILTKIKEHLNDDSTREALNKWEMDDDVKKMDIFYRKKDKGKLVPDAAPTLYPKLLTKFVADSNDPPIITTSFFNLDNVKYDVNTEMIGSRCKAYGAVVIDNIYVGAKPSVQVKLNDVVVVEKFNSQRCLLTVRPELKLPVDKRDNEDEDEDIEEPVVEKKKTTLVRRPKKATNN
jgi:hypothetical protein